MRFKAATPCSPVISFDANGYIESYLDCFRHELLSIKESVDVADVIVLAEVIGVSSVYDGQRLEKNIFVIRTIESFQGKKIPEILIFEFSLEGFCGCRQQFKFSRLIGGEYIFFLKGDIQGSLAYPPTYERVAKPRDDELDKAHERLHKRYQMAKRLLVEKFAP